VNKIRQIMSTKISEYFKVQPKVSVSNLVDEKFPKNKEFFLESMEEENSTKIRDCSVIVDDISKHLSKKLQFFQEISVKNSTKFETKMTKKEKNICDKELSSKSNLNAHMRTFYSDNLELNMKKKHLHGQNHQFECDFDGKIFKNKRLLKSHMAIHLALVECQFCNKMLKFNYIRFHLKNFHATGQKFQCKICSKYFKSVNYLNNHEKTHNKSHKCEICNKMYPSLGLLNYHKKNYHENSKSYECEICNMKCNLKGDLKSHQKTHDKNRPKPFTCQRCDFGTDIQYDIKKHQKSHERRDEKFAAMRNPVKCEKCPTFCRNKNALYLHMRFVHPKVTFQCDLCAKYLKTKNVLIKHFNTHVQKSQKITNDE